MFRRNGILGGVAAAMVLASAGWGWAQTPGGGRAPEPARAGEDLGRPVVTLNFKGGSVQEFVDLLRSSTKFPVNVMMSPETSRVKVGPVQLQDCPIWIAIEAVKWSAEDSTMAERLDVSPQDMNTNQPTNFSIRLRPMSPIAGPVFPSPVGYLDPTRSDFVGTYSISQVVNAPANLPGAKTLSIEQLTQAVDAVLRLTAQGSKPPTILVHKESGLLVVQGTSEQLRLAKEVIGQLREDVESSRKPLIKEMTQESINTEREERMKARRKALEMEIADMQARLKSVEDEIVARTSSKDTSPEGALRMEQASALRHQLRVTIDSLDAQLRELRLGTPAVGSGREVAALKAEIEDLRKELQTLRDQNSKK